MKRIITNDKIKRIMFRCSEDFYNLLKEFSEKKGITLSELIRISVIRTIADYDENMTQIIAKEEKKARYKNNTL